MSTILITGANRGIGLALAKAYHCRGDEVIAVCRKASPELHALNVRTLEGIDVSDAQAVKCLQDAVSDSVIDVLINNAGILGSDTFGAIDFEYMQRLFTVNALAPVRLTEALASRLSSQAKVVLITSRMGSMADNTSGATYGYRMSKAALNAAGVSLSHDLKPQGISVAILHPGYVQTDMVGGRGHVDAATAAEQLIKRIDQLNLQNSGTFWHANGDALPW